MNEPLTEKNFSYLDQLSPAEVFRILASAAEKRRGRYLEGVRIVFTGGGPYHFVTLEMPDPHGERQWESVNQKEVFESLLAAFKELTGREARYTSPGGESVPLLEGMARLFLQGGAGPDEKQAGSPGHQYLVVSGIMDEKKAEILFKNLCFHATFTRIACVEQVVSGAPRHTRYLFHVKDDPARKSSFAAIAASGLFERCGVLRGFEIGDRVVFLPHDVPPSERALNYFSLLVGAAPLLFGDRDVDDRGESLKLLAAFFRWPDSGDMEFFYLSRLHFYGQERFTRRKTERARFSYFDLKDSPSGLERLTEAIEHAEPYVGYRLELRPTRYLEKDSLEGLLDRKARLEHNIAYLQGVTAPRPVLMRFTRAQLPALAAQIRSFPLHVLNEGRIRYGFQVTDREPLGYHFIFIDLREAVRSEMDPLYMWHNLAVPHMRFRLDPFWAGHYFDGRSHSLVFVPEGRALFPSLHGWESGNMDGFLRETMGQWFGKDLEGRTLPARGIYIFDEDIDGTSLHISVLDRDRMEPLHMRLNWLNDNLAVHRNLEKEGLIEDLARDITWGEVAQKIKDHTEGTRKEFKEAALVTAQQMARTTSDMTRVLNIEIDRVVKETFRMTQKIRSMDERLREWDGVLAEMAEILNRLRRQKQDLTTRKSEAKSEFWRMEHQIEKELQLSEKRRAELEAGLEEEIKRMRIKAGHLKERLKRVKL